MARLVAALGLAVFLFFGWSMVRASAPTYDEPVHLASGYAALRNGARLLNAMDHPPLAEMWAALPLLALRPAALFQHPDWLNGRVFNYADLFLYKNRVDAARMLDSARLWCLASWGALAALGILGWAACLGAGAALAAAGLLMGLCPPLFTNAALVSTDAGSAVFFFLTFWLLKDARRGWGRWLAAGAAMGAAMACKFNMIVLPFFAGAMLLADWHLRRRTGRSSHSYQIKGGTVPQSGTDFPAAGALAALAAAAVVLAAAYRFVHWPVYWAGLGATLTRLGEGRSSFLCGTHLNGGSLLYFPVALAVKTPLPLLLAGAAGLWVMWRKVKEEGSQRFLELTWLAAPPAVYFLLACFSKTQIGYRHILPIYPFLIVAGAVGAGWAWQKRRGKIACVLLGAWLAASVLRSHPHYLAYFNEAVGGPDGGYRCLVDSNLDWGQGLKPLAESLRGMGNPPVFLCYFGVADPSYYGMRYQPVAPVSTVDARPGTGGPGDSDRVLFAVSVTNLQGTYYSNHSVFDWLKERRPLVRAGHSIFIYDLTDDPEGMKRLAEVMSAAGLHDEASRLLRRESKHVHPG